MEALGVAKMSRSSSPERPVLFLINCVLPIYVSSLRTLLLLLWRCAPLNVSTDLSISSLPSHLSPRTRLNLRYNYRHPLHLQGLKREKEPGKDAVGLISSIRVTSMSYDLPRRAAARYPI
jgi:hypothetical protein